MAYVTKVHRISGARTLRTSIPFKLAEQAEIKEGDAVQWIWKAKGVLVCRKVNP